jgi:YfiH family protein
MEGPSSAPPVAPDDVAAPDERVAPTPPAAPVAVERDGHWCWSGRLGTARFACYGRPLDGGGRDAESRLIEALERDGLELATLRQIHSARILEAVSGDCGEGDALISSRAGLALRVVTADCVPVLLASPSGIAAVHAGWRGLRSGILTAAARRLAPGQPLEAVIGPAIGGCCYEVGTEVANEVADHAGSRSVVLDRGAGRRPHLDLRLAARLELERAGVERITTLDACTRCDAERLWSYRRDGRGAGRNLALLWQV